MFFLACTQVLEPSPLSVNQSALIEAPHILRKTQRAPVRTDRSEADKGAIRRVGAGAPFSSDLRRNLYISLPETSRISVSTPATSTGYQRFAANSSSKDDH